VSVNTGAPSIKVKIDNQDFTNNITIGSKPKLNLELTDGNGVGAVHVYIDGTELKNLSLCALGAGSASVNTTVVPETALASGNHTILIEAEDSLGTKSTLSAFGLKVYADVAVQSKPVNYPNPFKPSKESTTINYWLSKDADVKLTIYDFTGKLVYSQLFASGSNGGQVNENTPSWDGKGFDGNRVGNGVYVYFLQSGGKVIGSGEMSVYE